MASNEKAIRRWELVAQSGYLIGASSRVTNGLIPEGVWKYRPLTICLQLAITFEDGIDNGTHLQG